ncbi:MULTISPECIES: hypothetical protein [unclassified Mycobacterium]|uniref:DUF7064 domain-containing protein n=1 Tax=unclassified Mycobacterium TaxID=2642494 RepID=UPI0029C8464C|nr:MULTISPECIES: hypothetical protein [unclassified Mycobacterium]
MFATNDGPARKDSALITELDEELHAPGTSPHWQESYYFNWSSDDGRSFGLTRIGLNRAAGKADAVVVMLQDGKPEFVYAAIGKALPPNVRSMSVGDGLTVGALTYTMVEPLGAWRIQLRGRNHLDLLWRAFTPAVDFHEGFPGAEDEVQRHFEQSGRVEGEVVVNHRGGRITGLGQRDKSWGVRDWNGVRGWEWIAGQFGEDLSFNATLTDVNGTQTPVGFVFDNGTTHKVRTVDVEYGGADPHRPQTALIHVETTDGGTYVITGRARARAPLFKSGLFIEETQFAFECRTGDDVREGLGVVEHAYHVGAAGLAVRLPRLLQLAAMALRNSR